jgi:alpha-glucosidase (family GH31 glycosyl hydrolase)
VYLPKGRWWHLFEERWYEGGRTVQVDAPLESIPVFLRDGAEIPLGFDGEIRLGATMPSGTAPPTHLVTLRAGTPLR